ncbi:MAG: preprotein translocase subunit SecG [Rickettsiaceae bacterium]|nr:preprotein translocase subunit SecG [Rickettsiaceae bacterium]MDP4832757.1 preprotein translocase subunit SecG [Rickettsiaceae bacterium]MDP5020955.1 preprotein translocase subunit SecG [Rickettsiaceae bacterium]MDP5083490.1 preprotein translocase subunit SecG [Rickettsiaceae bacterium]
MINTLLFIHLIIAILLVIVILLQKTSTDGLSGIGGGGGGNMGLVSGRSAASFLTRTTVMLAIIFFCNALVLANLSSQPRSNLTSKMENDSTQNSVDSSAEQETLPMAK